MSLPRDVLLRIGGRTLARCGRVAVYGYARGLGRGVVPDFTRADAGSFFDWDGLIRSAAVNILRKEYVDLNADGVRETMVLQLDSARTNVVLHNRDLTITHQLAVSGGAGTFTNGETVNAGGGGAGVYILTNSTTALFAIRGGSGTFTGTLTGASSGATRTIGSSAAVWTKSNMTATKNQGGIDGVASSATTIEATAANGTILQAITLASSVRYQSVYVQRRVGSGTINMTMDNGTTWTVIVLTAAWTRVTIPTQTIANPTVGFRIVTSGDSINIDGVQNENGLWRSSVILTTTAAVMRAVDALTVTANFGPVDMTVLARIARPVHADLSGSLGGLSPGVFRLGSGVGVLGLFFDATTRVMNAMLNGGTTVYASRAIPAGADLAFTCQFRNLTTGGQTALDVGDGAGYTSFSSATESFAAFGTQVVEVGNLQTFPLDGGLIDLMFARGFYTRAEMMALP